LGAKWPFDVDINESADPFKWILKCQEGGGQDDNLEPYDQVIKEGEGWVGLEPVLLTIFRVAKGLNFLLDTLL